MSILVCVYMNMHIVRVLRAHFGSLISERHCRINTIVFILFFLPFLELASNSLIATCGFSSLCTVNFLYYRHPWDPELVYLMATVHNNGNLFQSNVCHLFLPGNLAAVRIIGVSVIARCPQDES